MNQIKPTITSFTDLIVWQLAMDLAVKMHTLSKKFPSDERFGVTSQLRRASVSITANIAEGYGRYSHPDKRHKYIQARGEFTEVINLLLYCKSVDYISGNCCAMYIQKYAKVHILLNALIKSFSQKNNHSKSFNS